MGCLTQIVYFTIPDPPPSLNRPQVKTAAAGTWHSLVVDTNGELYAFGRCDSGQLGFACRSSTSSSCGASSFEKGGRYVDVPCAVEALAGKFVSQVARKTVLTFIHPLPRKP